MTPFQPGFSGIGRPARVGRYRPGPHAVPDGPTTPISTRNLLFFLALHVGLGLLSRSVPFVTTLHAVGVMLVAINITVRSKSIEKMLLVAMYTLGSGLFWRVGRAGVLWFFPEYITMFVFFFGLWRMKTEYPGITNALVFFFLLVPSTLLTVFAMDFSQARETIAFYMSPMLLLALSMYTVSKFDLRLEAIRKIAIVSMFPLMANWALAAYNVFIVGVKYGASSSDFAAGGMASNQVSNGLSYGGIAMLIAAMMPGSDRKQRKVLYAVAALLLVQSILTFSRGGIYNAGIFIVCAVPFFLRDRKTRWRFLLTFAVATFLASEFLLPSLDTFTQGSLTKRYEKESTTGRDVLIFQDIQIFLANPLTGVGPGVAREMRQLVNLHGVAAHTEYTRILAEHGLLGLVALVMLFSMSWRIYKRANQHWKKGLTAGSLAWIFMMLSHSATRVPMFIMFAILAIAIAYSTEKYGEEAPSGHADARR